jgi:aminocarboxymuconate-semialdehyde decarboxylase
MSVPRPGPVIDFHAHMLAPGLLDTCGPHSVQTGFGARAFPKPGDGGDKGAVYALMTDPDALVAAMDARGIDRCVVSVSTVLQRTSWAAAPDDARMTAQINDEVARWVGLYPNRLIGAFTLPLTDQALTLAELERASGVLGLRVANLPASVGGVYLGEADFHPLWRRLEQQNIPSFIHPDGVTDPWFQKFRMWNSIGQSIEEAKVMASIIYEGVFDRFPGLKIVMAHGGGYFPHYTGRLDRNVTNYPDTMVNIGAPPSEYLDCFYYDTCVYDTGVLAALVDRVGAKRLVMGSDYPVGERDPVGFIRSCPKLSAVDAADIAGGNAAALLG